MNEFKKLMETISSVVREGDSSRFDISVGNDSVGILDQGAPAFEMPLSEWEKLIETFVDISSAYGKHYTFRKN